MTPYAIFAIALTIAYILAGRKVAAGIGSISIDALEQGLFMAKCKGETIKFTK